MRITRTLAATAALSLTLASCSLGGSEESSSPTPAPAPAPTTDPVETGGEDDTADDDGTAGGPGADAGDATSEAPVADPGSVTLITHSSFHVPDELVSAFEEESGYELAIQQADDAGALTNQLVLTKGSPIADAIFGIDNTFATRAINEEVLASYSPESLPESAEEHALPEGGDQFLTPVDYGDVCVNVDTAWFMNEGITPPATLADLTKPEYEDLFVFPGASTSSPGLAFLLATIGEFGATEWQGYWEDLMANGAKVTSGWTDAYTVDFTGGGGEDGDRPIVLSYASSPPFTIPEGGSEPTTAALLDTCFRQVEYAGVLEGAANPEGAQAVVDWLVSPEVQASIPDNMYMFPVDAEVELPELWAQWAQVAENPIVVHPGQIEDERENWLREWADIATG